MSERLLQPLIDTWLPLARRQIVPRFPAPLEAAYQADAGASKLMALRVGSTVGVTSGFLIIPSLWHLMPDAHGAMLWLWFLGAMPIGLTSTLIMWTTVPIGVQETQVAIVQVVVSGLFTALMASTRTPIFSVYLGGMLLMVMLHVVTAGFRFQVAALYGGAQVAMFCLCVSHFSGGSSDLAALGAMQMIVCTGFALFGSWRVESETRHSYARMLRERAQQKLLAARNVELDQLTLRDPLTGLSNRRAYQTWEDGPWQAAGASAMSVGLVMVDIDHFKAFNDFYGHPAGDMCLQAVARCMADQLRGTTDLVARIGGEEFAILLPGASLAMAGDVAERLRTVIEAMDLPHAGCGVGAAVTISCGSSAAVVQANVTLSALSEAADAALYEAKQGGRNRVCLAEWQAQAPLRAKREVAPQG